MGTRSLAVRDLVRRALIAATRARENRPSHEIHAGNCTNGGVKPFLDMGLHESTHRAATFELHSAAGHVFLFGLRST
jgi:hypothetical protein